MNTQNSTHVCLSIRLSIHVSVCLSVCPFVFLAVQYMCACMSTVCPSLFPSISFNHSTSLSSGQISLAEFMEGAQKDEWLMEMLKLDFNASGWVNQNWVKKTPWHKDISNFWNLNWVICIDGINLSGDGNVFFQLSRTRVCYCQRCYKYGGLHIRVAGNCTDLWDLTLFLRWWMWHWLENLTRDTCLQHFAQIV